MDAELHCVVCKNILSNPLLLPCGHSICSDCASNEQGSITNKSFSQEENSGSSISTVASSFSNCSASGTLHIGHNVDIYSDTDKNSTHSETDSGVILCSSRPDSFATNSNFKGVRSKYSKFYLTCSTCQRVIYSDENGYVSLPRYLAMEHILEKYINQGVSKCHLCVSDPPSNATVFCKQCEVLYCSECREKYHPSRGPLAKHILTDCKDSDELHFKTKTNSHYCSEHHEELVSLFCIICKHPVCSVCMQDGRHNGHDIQTLNTLCKELKVELSQSLQQLSSKARATKENLCNLKNTNIIIDENCVELEGEIVARCDALIDAINRKKMKLIEIIRKQRGTKKQLINDQVANSSLKLQQTTGFFQYCFEVLKEPDATAFLQVSSLLMDRLSFLESNWNKEIDVILDDATTRFDLTLDDKCVMKCIEKLNFMQLRDANEVSFVSPEEVWLYDLNCGTTGITDSLYNNNINTSNSNIISETNLIEQFATDPPIQDINATYDDKLFPTNVGDIGIPTKNNNNGNFKNEGKRKRRNNLEIEKVKKLKDETTKKERDVKKSCDTEKCRKKCICKINQSQRMKINSQYWKLSWIERRKFILDMCKRVDVKRRTGYTNKKKSQNFKYYLEDRKCKRQEVCKTFFLTTLGYKKGNDATVFHVLSQTPNGNPLPDMRGKHTPSNKIQDEKIIEHIKNFNRYINHQDSSKIIAMTTMYKDFLKNFPNFKLSYQSYVAKVKQVNIVPNAPIIIPEECSAENNTVTIGWQQPPYSCVEGYLLELDDGCNGDFKQVYCGKQTVCTVDGLQFNRIYSARVKSFNKAGDGDYSDVIGLQTSDVAWFAFEPSISSPDLLFSSGNLSITCEGFEHRLALGNIGFTHGVHYWQYSIDRFDSDTDPSFGVATIDVSRNLMLGKDNKGWGMYIDKQRSWFVHNGIHEKRCDGGISVGSTVGVLLDLIKHQLRFYVNDQPQGPIAFNNIVYGELYAAVSINRGVAITLHTGLDPPEGYGLK